MRSKGGNREKKESTRLGEIDGLERVEMQKREREKKINQIRKYERERERVWVSEGKSEKLNYWEWREKDGLEKWVK